MITTAAFLLSLLAGAYVGEVSPVARDGDTIVVEDVPVRLSGIAAPELSEPGGYAALDAVLRLTAGKVVFCRLTGAQSYDREVGVCFVDDEDLGALLVEGGFARDCPRYSGGGYAKHETPASRRLPFPDYCKVKQ